jgi:hypothetical protein
LRESKALQRQCSRSNLLQLLIKSVSGNKSILAKQLLAALVIETQNDLPLAADCITDKREFDSVVDEDDN